MKLNTMIDHRFVSEIREIIIQAKQKLIRLLILQW